MSEAVPKQDLSRLSVAIAEFQQHLPDWWWSIGTCGVCRDASCGPDRDGRDSHLRQVQLFANSFHCVDPDGDLADALRSVMLQGMAAREAHLQDSSK